MTNCNFSTQYCQDYNKASNQYTGKFLYMNPHALSDYKNFSETEMTKICTILKNLREPWSLVIEKWLHTSRYRLDQISKNKDVTIESLLEEWPLYKHSMAPELVRFVV